MAVPIITQLDFSQLQKIVPAHAFNFIIVATNAGSASGKWNMHAVGPSDNIFTQPHL